MDGPICIAPFVTWNRTKLRFRVEVSDKLRLDRDRSYQTFGFDSLHERCASQGVNLKVGLPKADSYNPVTPSKKK